MLRSRARTVLGLICCALLLPAAIQAKKPKQAAVRWTANAPGCTYARTADGHLRWTMSDEDLDISLVVDSKELARSRQRFRHPFSLYLGVHYKGQDSFVFEQNLWLQFVLHHKVAESYLDPAEFQNHLQNDLDTEVFETERKIRKHPELKDAETARLQQYEKIGAEFIEFLTRESLAPATLNPGNPEVHGWVYFGTKNKWIGSFHEHEDFVLEVRTKDKIWQFPFALPPGDAEPALRNPDDEHP